MAATAAPQYAEQALDSWDNHGSTGTSSWDSSSSSWASAGVADTSFFSVGPADSYSGHSDAGHSFDGHSDGGHSLESHSFGGHSGGLVAPNSNQLEEIRQRWQQYLPALSNVSCYKKRFLNNSWFHHHKIILKSLLKIS